MICAGAPPDDLTISHSLLLGLRTLEAQPYCCRVLRRQVDGADDLEGKSFGIEKHASGLFGIPVEMNLLAGGIVALVLQGKSGTHSCSCLG